MKVLKDLFTNGFDLSPAPLGNLYRGRQQRLEADGPVCEDGVIVLGVNVI